MSGVLVAPYLPLSERTDVAGWSLVPFAQLSDGDCVDQGSSETAQLLVEVYQQPPSASLGVLIAPPQGAIGTDFDRNEIPRLRRALFSGVINANPPMTAEDTSNSGHRSAAAESALVYGHPLSDGRTYAISEGALVSSDRLFHAGPGESLPGISFPSEMAAPIHDCFDADLANETLAILQTEGALGRRVSRFLDWFLIATSNATSITADVRVEAARSGLEVLTGSGDKTKNLVRAYGRLHGDSDSTRTYPASEVFWSKGQVELAASEWWMTRICELRNRIVHGDEVPNDLWFHDDQHQVSQIHDHLVASIRRLIAKETGDQTFEADPRRRSFHRAYRRAEESLEEPPS